MKHISRLILAVLLITLPAFAQDNISTSTGIIGNGKLLGAKTYDGQTTVGVLGIDSSGNTTIQSLSGKSVNIPGTLTTTGVTSFANGTGALPSIAFTSDLDTGIFRSAANTIGLAAGGVSEITVADDNLTFTGAAASIVGGATSLTVGSSGSTILRADADANRLVTFDASSDTTIIQSFGDGGTTANQTGLIAASTADADDDSLTVICGGGAESSARGACIRLRGEEFTGGGDLFLTAGDADNVNILSGSTTVGSFDATGLTFATTGQTVAVDSGTAASACKGTGTHNGTTAVTVSTTCAATGMHVSLTHTSDPTGSTAAYCWVTNIVNGTSFDVDCDQANDGTFSWLIIKEG